jgi:hypothetical protein
VFTWLDLRHGLSIDTIKIVAMMTAIIMKTRSNMTRIIVTLAAGIGAWVLLSQFAVLNKSIPDVGISWATILTAGICIAAMNLGKNN